MLIPFCSDGPPGTQFLSNFASSPLHLPVPDATPAGNYRLLVRRFDTVEHAYQYTRASLFGFDQTAVDIAEAPTPLLAKRLGTQVRRQLPSDAIDAWNHLVPLLMKSLLLRKFSSSELVTALTATAPHTLVEATPDPLWGAGCPLTSLQSSYSGNNLLGRLLMEVRDAVLHGEHFLSTLWVSDETIRSSKEHSFEEGKIFAIPGTDTIRLLQLVHCLSTLKENSWIISLSQRDLHHRLQLTWYNGQERAVSQSSQSRYRPRIPYQARCACRQGLDDLCRYGPTGLTVVLVPYPPVPFPSSDGEDYGIKIRSLRHRLLEELEEFRGPWSSTNRWLSPSTAIATLAEWTWGGALLRFQRFPSLSGNPRLQPRAQRSSDGTDDLSGATGRLPLDFSVEGSF